MMFCVVKVNNNPAEAARTISQALETNNVVHVIAQSSDLNWWSQCGNIIGTLAPMEENMDGDKNGNLFTDIRHPWHEPSNSFSHSNTRQPLHTDGSYESKAPQLTFFFCKESPEIGGETTFISLEKLMNLIQEHDPEFLEELKTTVVTHSKGADFKKQTIINQDKINWNYFRCEHCELRDKFHNFLEESIVAKHTHEIKLQPCEALIFKDEYLLHGRNSFQGNRWLIKGGIWTITE